MTDGDNSYRAHSRTVSGSVVHVVSHDAISVHDATHDIWRVEAPSALALCDDTGPDERPPIKAGWLTKRGHRLGCLPVWKRRYFVLKAQYLFKFESPSSTSPKGQPLHIMGATCCIGPIDPSSSAATHGHKATMTLSTLRKETILGAEDEATLHEWIAAFERARAIAIKQELGHAPTSAGEAFANRSGAFLAQKRMEREIDDDEQSRRGQFLG